MGIYSHQETGDWLTYRRDQKVKEWALKTFGTMPRFSLHALKYFWTPSGRGSMGCKFSQGAGIRIRGS